MNQEVLPIAQEGESQINLFKRKKIRQVFNENEWWFSVKDVIEALVETPDGTGYIRKIRNRDKGLKSRWGQIVRTLPFKSLSGTQQTYFVNIEGIFRLMQSVPTKRMEPFKKWLAKVGYERIQELQDPEIAIKRAIAIYKAKGYPDDWVDVRITNKISRERLVAEWDKRGLKEPLHFAILTNAIHVKTFDIETPKHKEIKGLKGQSLRDNMTPLELTLITLGEQTAKAISESRDDYGYPKLCSSAEDAGRIAGNARKEIEKKTGNKVVSPRNYLTERQRRKVLQMPDNINETMKKLLEVPAPKK